MVKKSASGIVFLSIIFLTVVTFPMDNNTQKTTSWSLGKQWQEYQAKRTAEKAARCVGSRPPFYKTDFCESGKYTQFTVDSKAFYSSLFAGSIARVLYSLTHRSTTFETFKTNIVIPGFAKSAFFWIPSIFVYNVVVQNKEIEQRFKQLASEQNTRTNVAAHVYGDSVHQEDVHASEAQDSKSNNK